MKEKCAYKCKCKVCERSHKFQRIIKRLPKSQQKFMNNVEMELMYAEDDNSFLRLRLEEVREDLTKYMRHVDMLNEKIEKLTVINQARGASNVTGYL